MRYCVRECCTSIEVVSVCCLDDLFTLLLSFNVFRITFCKDTSCYPFPVHVLKAKAKISLLVSASLHPGNPCRSISLLSFSLISSRLLCPTPCFLSFPSPCFPVFLNGPFSCFRLHPVFLHSSASLAGNLN